ncbi:hypothetical protein [Tessaracoccus antarcticus]|uniref:Phosphodiester glycosidase domain-containing protein n=1 Tax=Tessaracoccus antarcticus TaxID=2479848 RepID=A0A3M0GC70_9ACTN|nr:hypothetical protein [Tessaracoccus antarcticus]RMB61958.1 hypothetical protein EAX62_05055 [Tessaracoccus antarcticus]
MTIPDQTITPIPIPPGDMQHNAPPRRRVRRLRIVALVVALLLIAPGISYTQALTAPGYASWSERSVGWVRDNGGAGMVDAIENWWYTRHAPSNATPLTATLPGPPRVQQGNPTVAPRVPAPPSIAPLAGAAPLEGEGLWSVDVMGRAGVPVLYSTFLRPDPSHASVVAGAVWVPAGATAAHLVAGTSQPHGWGGAARIPAADMGSIVATFNSGWKFGDMDGGFYLGGRQSPALRDGLASVVIDARGHVTIGQWGRDISMTRDVVAVRQNLHLIVEGGTPVHGLDVNGGGVWGSPRNQLQYTWRSGLGTDAAGNLVYVAGNNLTLQSLATAMSDAGVRQGMELDIHSRMVNLAVWTHPSGGHATASNLLPNMSASPTRYVAADQRDFFYLTLK